MNRILLSLRSSIAAVLLAIPAVHGLAENSFVVADFEDVGTWRARPGAGVPPEAWFSGNLFLASSDHEKRNGDWVGEIRYLFNKAPGRLALEREKMSRTSSFMKGIAFEAHDQGADCSLSFEIEDSARAKFQTSAIPLRGNAWQSYRLDLNAGTVRGFEKIRFPVVLRRIFLSKDTPGAGSIFLDDLRVIGRISSANQLAIRPVYSDLAHAPGAPVKLSYRIRNATPAEQTGEAVLKLADVRGGETREIRQAFVAPASGEMEICFDGGIYPVGAYSGKLALSAGELRAEYLDFFGVFAPNNRQENSSPMWFGVQDLTTWQGEAENTLHLEWMKQLGLNIARVGIIGPWLEPARGQFQNAPLAKMLKQLGDGGIMVNLLYSDAVPDWTQSSPAWRRPPTDWEAFQEHAGHVGQFLSGFPNVKYLEFWNEPDVEFFKGTLPEYLEMLKRFGAGFRPAAPGIKLTSAGVTVKHPAEKSGMSKGVIQQPDLYDIAGFHSHGSAADYALRFDMVEKWMAGTGAKRPIANTESGFRSGYDVPGALGQAVALTQKITEAKSHANAEFFIWFTLQDYWDMDQKADDSMGLVTSDNRAKPSFVAYNELIRRLANTEPLGRADLHPSLVTYAFRKKDGTLVYVCWPDGGRSAARLWVKSEAKYTVADMFGLERELPGGTGLLALSRHPVYLQSSQAGDELKLVSAGENFFDIPESLTIGMDRSLPIRIRNIWKAPIACTIAVKSEDGEVAGAKVLSVQPGAELYNAVVLPLSGAGNYKTGNVFVELAVTGGATQKVTIPVEVNSPYPVGKSLDTAPVIRLDKIADVTELAYDPFRPAWRGPDDLSVDARLAHDSKSLLIRFEVKDAAHAQNEGESEMWKGDSLQMAFQTSAGRQVELAFGLRPNSDSTVWRVIPDAPEQTGRWKIPFTAKREGKLTIYEAQIPLAELGLAYDGSPVPFRMAFVLNNNDGDGRIRFMQWFGGVAGSKDPNQFGFATLY